MLEVFALLFVVYAEEYFKLYHGAKYAFVQDKIQEYHIDDAAEVYRIYKNNRVEFRWEF